MSFWPFRIQHTDVVPGTSRWIASVLRDCDLEALQDVSSVVSKAESAHQELQEFLLRAQNDATGSFLTELGISSSPAHVSRAQSPVLKQADRFLNSLPIAEIQPQRRNEDSQIIILSSSRSSVNRVSLVLSRQSVTAPTAALTPVRLKVAAKEDAGENNKVHREHSRGNIDKVRVDPEHNETVDIQQSKQPDSEERESGKTRQVHPAHSETKQNESAKESVGAANKSAKDSNKDVDPKQNKIQNKTAPKLESESTQRPNPSVNGIIPKDTKVSDFNTLEALEDLESLQRIQKSIRRRTEIERPAKTPVRSPLFVPLPKREPLTIESSSRKSLRPSSGPKQDTSPMRRNRFPSFVDTTTTAEPRKSIPKQPGSERKNLFENEMKLIAKPQKSAPEALPQRQLSLLKEQLIPSPVKGSLSIPSSKPQTSPIPSPIKTHTGTPRVPLSTPFSHAKLARESTTSSPGLNLTKSRPVSMVTDDNDTYSSTRLIPKFMSPTGSSIAKVKSHTENNRKSKFMTTTLGPNTRLSRHTPRAKSPVKKAVPKKSLDPRGSLVQKPLVPKLDPRQDLKPKQKLVISMKHKTPTSARPSSLSLKIKHKLNAPTSSYKRRQLGGNGVALPEEARPKIIKREVSKKDATPNEKSILIHQDSPGLPQIGSDDELGVVLKPWAESSVLRQLVLESKEMNPRDIFGDVPAFDSDAVFHN